MLRYSCTGLVFVLLFMLTPTLFIYSPTSIGPQDLDELSYLSLDADGPIIQNLTYEITNYTDGSNDAITIFCECSMLSNNTQPAWQEHYWGNYLANRFVWDGESFNYTYSINPFLVSFNITIILYDDLNNTATEQIHVDYIEGKELIRNLPPEEFPDLTETSPTEVYVGENATMVWYVMDNVLGLEVLLNGIVLEGDIFVNETPFVLRYEFTSLEESVYHFSVRGYIEGTPFNTSSSLFVIGGYQQLMALSVPITSTTTTNGQIDPTNQLPVLLTAAAGFGIIIVVVLVLIRKKAI